LRIISVPQNLNKTRLILGQKKVSRGTGGGVLEGVADTVATFALHH